MTDTDQRDLFGATPPPQYPDTPGHRRRDTSKRAAESVKAKAPPMREIVLQVLRAAGPGGLTPEEIRGKASIMTRRKLNILQIRPRVTELARNGLIEDTGRRGESELGLARGSICWRVVN